MEKFDNNKHRSRRRNHRNPKAKKPPKVPIKTYRWEDIRRARRRGGYPWTHLYKGPFTEQIDPEQFTMDALRRSKSSSPMGRRSDRIEILEVSSWADYSGKTTPTLLQELIDEPIDNLSAKNSRPSSVVIEEYVEHDDKDLEDDVQIKEFQMESAESSDNVSQYLDKEEGAPTPSKSLNNDDADRERRAKSEDTVQRKRKLSGESSHSSFSFTKIGVLKKMQDAKSKIKVPKLSFPTKKLTRKQSSLPKEEKPKTESKKPLESSRLKKEQKPEYIFIPLKPPPGESDEFSHLEFEAKNNNNNRKTENEPTLETKSEEQETKPEKDIQVTDKTIETKSEKQADEKIKTEESNIAEENKSPFSTLEKGPKVTKKPPLKINPAFKKFLKDVRELKDKEENQTTDIKPKNLMEEGVKEMDLEEQQTPETPKEDFDKLFEASTSRALEEPSRNIRSKSAEPQQQRRSSMDSSYSRKSLSKLAIMKKLKTASDRIKSALSMENLRKKIGIKETKPETEVEKEKEKVKKSKLTSVIKPGQSNLTPKKIEPVYIHIPLKPPEGQTDEFSYLENEPTDLGVTAAPESPTKEERADSLDSISSPSPPGGVQFIFLTPPSDDEILEKDVDVPETPSSPSDELMFFSSLKKLAEDAVDQVSPETRRKGLETVSEESDKGSSEIDLSKEPSINDEVEATEAGEKTLEVVEDAKTADEVKDEKIIIDVEDGLNEALKQEETLKSALKTTESGSSPVNLQKKVSFKRKSKTNKDKDNDKDNGYEVIEVPKKENIITKLNAPDAEDKHDENVAQSMSVDEEKCYLEQKNAKDTSLEEDYNKWSKEAGDHEYEPINQSADEMAIMTIPNVAVVDRDTDPKLVISAKDILDKPLAEEKKKSFFQFGRGDKEKNQERGDSTSTKSSSSRGKEIPEIEEPPKNEGPNKFQVALKQGTQQLKNKTNELRNKLQNIKRPSLNLPKAPEFKKPNFKRFKIEKPNFNLQLRTTSSRTVETRQLSTESNVDDSELQETKPRRFDLTFGGTFPRFKKSKKPQEVVFATVPRPKNDKQSAKISSEGSSSIRIPLHSEDSTDASERLNLEEVPEAPRSRFEDRETSGDLARLSGDVALEEEYERENQAINRADYLSRWQHGNFKERKDENEDERIVGQLVEQRFGKMGHQQGYHDRPETLEDRLRRDEERLHYVEDTEEEEFDLRLNQNKLMVTDLDNLEDENGALDRGGYSSEGSESVHKKGRLGKLDIDSDEFFVVHEIREGFQNPINALAQMNEYDPIGSNRSLPVQIQQEPIKTERKSIKKPKRKKTPHVSREEIPGDEESVEKTIAPSRPKRRSKRNKKNKPEKEEKVIPYQETIPLEMDLPHGDRLEFPRESLGILADDEREEQEVEMCENERMQGKQRPDIMITDPYKEFHVTEQRFRQREEMIIQPNAPPRKHRSLRSLTSSVNESILMEDRTDLELDQLPPKRPSRRSRSHTSSLSRVSLPPSQRDTDSIFTDEGYLAENQQIPSYLIENQNYKEQYQGILDQQPCKEPPCVQDIRDYMGYAIVDKSKPREPPLPPPRTPPRRRKRDVEPDQKFATVPRHIGMSQAPPVRPLRNYSTLSHVRSSPNSSAYANDKEDKENQMNIIQYIEIEDDVNRDLVSGEVVQKMRQRPLPAPPRPPRKTKSSRKSLQDITNEENIMPSTPEHKQTYSKEETVSTQTEPLPPGFVCEEIRQEPTDTIITPRFQSESSLTQEPSVSKPNIARFEIYDPRHRQATDKPEIRRELITPKVYSFEETVTHGTLLVQPINGSKVVPDHQLSREHLVPITKEFSDDETTSEVPETFKQLKNPEEKEVKADKIQVANIDVDSLTVNQLLASKIVVSEIEASTISTNEIQGKSGPLKFGNIDLPPELLEQLVKKVQEDVQKKTPLVESVSIEENLDLVVESSPQAQSLEDRLHQDVARRESSIETHEMEDSCLHHRESSVESYEISPPPMPPTRGCTLDEAAPEAPPRTLRRTSKQDSPIRLDPKRAPTPSPVRNDMIEPDIDDQPPPRPPQPLEGLYLSSQPPASFYALRAKQYVDENIPTAPRRKRHHSGKSRPVSRSRSTSDDSSTVPHRPPSRLHRRASEPSISELSGRLIQACGSRINSTLKRLIYNLTENVLRNANGNQDLQIFMIILLVLIAGLILLGYGEERTVIHLHHWEYFNPPKDL